MRVTSQQMINHATGSLTRLADRLLEAQRIIASGKRVNKPSDDPTAMARILDYRTTLESLDQYTNNIEQAESRAAYTDSVLDFVDKLIERARGIAQDYSQGDPGGYAATAAEEVRDIYDQVIELANSKFGDVYIFAGSKSQTPPFIRDEDFNATYQGNADAVRIVIGENQHVKLNADGEAIFQDPSGGADLFSALKDLINGLETDDTDLIQAQVENLQEAQFHNHSTRTGYGTNLSRLEVSKNHWTSFKSKVEVMLSDLENADPAEAIITMQNIENAYQTTIMTAARVIQPTLIQFLK